MNDDGFPDTFAAARRPGAYLRIVSAGAIAAGDTIAVDPAEAPAIRIDQLVDDDIDPAVFRQILGDSRVPEVWRRAARRGLRT